MQFNLLDISRSWDDYWSEHPNGYSPQEQMINWAGQLNAMIDFFNKYFDVDLTEYATEVMEGWYVDGRLDEIINDALFDIVDTNTSQLAEKVNQSDFKNVRDIVGNGFVKALGTRLSQGIQPSCITLIGDSTGNASDEWFYKTMEWLAAQYPDYTTKYKMWDSVSDNYLPEYIYRAGTGIRPVSGVKIARGLGNYISAPHNANQAITGDIDIKIKLSLDELDISRLFLSKFGSAGQRGYAVGILENNVPYLWISNDGTANHTITASAPIPYQAKEVFWLRYILDVDGDGSNHAVTFYTSDDGLNWVQLGIQILTAGVTSLFNTTAPIEIFSRGGGQSDYTGGTFYEAEIRRGFDGVLVANPKVITSQTPFTDSLSNVFTINGVFSFNDLKTIYFQNASVPGANIDYSKVPERLIKQLEIEPQLTFISYCHNDGANINYTQRYEDFCKQIQALYPNTGIVCVTQNPQQYPELNITAHAIRNSQIALVSAKNNFGLVDVNRVFNETGNAAAYNLNGAHPNAEGTVLWVNEVIKFLKPLTK